MLITQRRAIERRLPLRDASYKQVAEEFGISITSVCRIAAAIGHSRGRLGLYGGGRLKFMVRAQNKLLEFRKKYSKKKRTLPHAP